RARAAITGAVFMKFGRAPTTESTWRTGRTGRRLGGFVQRLQLAAQRERDERLLLVLAHLARTEVELASDLGHRRGLVRPVEAVAHAHDRALRLRQVGDLAQDDVLAPGHMDRLVDRLLAGGQQVAEGGVALGADR